jgi:hypothetical protein
MAKEELNTNLYRLTDAFRRAADFNKPEPAKALVQLTKDFGIALTYYYPEYNDSFNSQLATKVSDILSEMATIAKDEGLNKIELPLVLKFDGEENPTANWINRQILSNNSYAVPVELMAQPYDTDLSGIGNINDDLTEKTVLAEGISGVVDTSDNIRNQWVREKHVRNQLGFDF